LSAGAKGSFSKIMKLLGRPDTAKALIIIKKTEKKLDNL